MGRPKFEMPEDHPAQNFEGEDSEARQMAEKLKRRGGQFLRHTALRSADMARISSMLLQGASTDDMASELGLNIKTVNDDLRHLNMLWVQQIKENSEQFRGVLLSKLQNLEALALESFAESKERTVTDHTTHADGGVSRSVKTFMTAGDAAFLNVAKDSIKQQMAVLGLDQAGSSIKAFDKEAFLDAVAEKIAEAKIAATAVPAMALELKQVEQEAKDAGLPM
jgi:hypothetical protein